MIKTSNREASRWVEEQKDFKGNNTFGKWINSDFYVVYSYGEHWILYLYVKEYNVWLGCDEKYHRPTTNKHRTQLHPNVEITDWVDQSVLQDIIKYC